MFQLKQTETVIITKKEHEYLKNRDLHLEILECRGVDNWQGYCGVPDREDYETDEEYNQALEKAFNYDD